MAMVKRTHLGQQGIDGARGRCGLIEHAERVPADVAGDDPGRTMEPARPLPEVDHGSVVRGMLPPLVNGGGHHRGHAGSRSSRPHALTSRKPAALTRIKDPHRTVEIACFLRLEMLRLTDASLTLLDHRIAALWRGARERAEGARESRLRRFRELHGDLAGLAANEALDAAELRSRLQAVIARFEPERGATVEVFAARLGMTARHLNRLFAQHWGASPSIVARIARVQRAKRLLNETELPMVEVALQAGFGSLRRFNAVFSEVYKRPPGAIRRRCLPSHL